MEQVYQPNLQGFLKLRKDFIIMVNNDVDEYVTSQYDVFENEYIDAYYKTLNNSIEYLNITIKENLAKKLIINAFPNHSVDDDLSTNKKNTLIFYAIIYENIIDVIILAKSNYHIRIKNSIINNKQWNVSFKKQNHT